MRCRVAAIVIGIIISFTVTAIPLYYKNHSGKVYGPFPEEQIYDWWMAGYFSNDILVSKDHYEYVPVSSYFTQPRVDKSWEQRNYQLSIQQNDESIDDYSQQYNPAIKKPSFWTSIKEKTTKIFGTLHPQSRPTQSEIEHDIDDEWSQFDQQNINKKNTTSRISNFDNNEIPTASEPMQQVDEFDKYYPNEFGATDVGTSSAPTYSNNDTYSQPQGIDTPFNKPIPSESSDKLASYDTIDSIISSQESSAASSSTSRMPVSVGSLNRRQQEDHTWSDYDSRGQYISDDNSDINKKSPATTSTTTAPAFLSKVTETLSPITTSIPSSKKYKILVRLASTMYFIFSFFLSLFSPLPIRLSIRLLPTLLSGSGLQLLLLSLLTTIKTIVTVFAYFLTSNYLSLLFSADEKYIRNILTMIPTIISTSTSSQQPSDEIPFSLFSDTNNFDQNDIDFNKGFSDDNDNIFNDINTSDISEFQEMMATIQSRIQSKLSLLFSLSSKYITTDFIIQFSSFTKSIIQLLRSNGGIILFVSILGLLFTMPSIQSSLVKSAVRNIHYQQRDVFTADNLSFLSPNVTGNTSPGSSTGNTINDKSKNSIESYQYDYYETITGNALQVLLQSASVLSLLGSNLGIIAFIWSIIRTTTTATASTSSTSEYLNTVSSAATDPVLKLTIISLLATSPFILSILAILTELYSCHITTSTSSTGTTNISPNDPKKANEGKYYDYINTLLQRQETDVDDVAHRWNLTPLLKKIRDDLSVTNNNSNNPPIEYNSHPSRKSKFSLFSLFSESRRLFWTSAILTSSGIAMITIFIELAKILIITEDKLCLTSSYIKKLYLLMHGILATLTLSPSLLSSSSLATFYRVQWVMFVSLLYTLPSFTWSQFLNIRRSFQGGSTSTSTGGLTGAQLLVTLLEAQRQRVKARKEASRYGSKDGSASDSPEGWTIDGPDPRAGIQFHRVVLTEKDRTVLQDVTVTFPPGSITVLVGTTPSSGKTAILRSIWGDASLSLQVGGTVVVRGRDRKEWERRSMRERITYLKEEEEKLYLPAGIVAGLVAGQGDKARQMERHRRAVEASGAADVFNTLPFGPNTLLSEDTPLTAAQWRSLAICRALSYCERDVVLLDSPSSTLSETQEASLFRALRAGLRRDQVVVVACPRFASAIHADKVVVLSGGKVIQQGTYSQLISQPGPFREELMPTPRPVMTPVTPTGSSSLTSTLKIQMAKFD